MNMAKIMSKYHKKMEELGTRDARDAWCLKVEQDLSCSTEEEDSIPPGLLRVRKLENDILNVVSLLFSFALSTDITTFSDHSGCLV
jgi:hypothetical protein